MASLDQSIRDAVLGFLKRSGMSGRRFGRDALGDPGFVASLARGRRLRLGTADRVLAFMGEPPIGPAFRREVEAFLKLGGAKPYVLGEAAARDPSFVARLRRGVSFRLETVERVRAWMGGNACDAARAAMREAVADAPLLAERGGDGAGGPPESEHKGENPMKDARTRYLSTRKAAAWLGLSPRTLDRYRIDGEGPSFYRFGSRILYLEADLEKWAATRRVRTAGDDGAGHPASGAPGTAAPAVAVLAVLAGAAAFGLGVDPALAASDTTFTGPLDTVTGMVAGTGGQLAAALAVGAALVGSVLKFNAMQLLGAVGVGVAAGAGVGIVTGLVGTAIV